MDNVFQTQNHTTVIGNVGNSATLPCAVNMELKYGVVSNYKLTPLLNLKKNTLGNIGNSATLPCAVNMELKYGVVSNYKLTSLLN